MLPLVLSLMLTSNAAAAPEQNDKAQQEQLDFKIKALVAGAIVYGSGGLISAGIVGVYFWLMVSTTMLTPYAGIILAGITLASFAGAIAIVFPPTTLVAFIFFENNRWAFGL